MLIVVIDRGIQELCAFTLEEIKLGIDSDDLIDRAPRFQATFRDLRDALRKRRKRARIEETAQQTPASAFILSSASQEEPKTPDQPIHPIDANYSGMSGSSTESKPEGAPNVLIADFLKESICSFGRAMQKLSWPVTQNIVGIGFS